MKHKISIIILLLCWLSVSLLSAQEDLPNNWNSEKIKGTRYVPNDFYQGNPFLTDNFVPGVIEMEDGTTIGSLQLRYNTYRDELIYFNAEISTQIVIDKISLSGFSLTDDKGIQRNFRQFQYAGYLSGNRYFEMLSKGNVSLLAFRKIVLQDCPAYYNESGKLKNMSYQEAYSYYLYNPQTGYELIKPDLSSLLSKFDQPNQKRVRKLLRENKIRIRDEKSFVKGWNLISDNKIAVQNGPK